ncbi:MAG TPA: nitronate monooxygenase [Acidimicrobiales bacterium]|nr:nitronate monooxygenase [Acidimicrobiales bacterium]
MDTVRPGGPLWHVAAAERLRDLSRWPVVVAPMAGGPSTPGLVAAAAEAGALGFLAGGYRTADALRADIDAVRAASAGAFGVNLFVPGEAAADPAALAVYVHALEQEAGALGAAVGPAVWDDDAYDEKVAVVLELAPSLVTFTFGCPSPDLVRALQERGVLVGITVTTPEEAALALGVGPDCLCLQGAEAGAHRGSFRNDHRPDAEQDIPLMRLVADAAALVDVAGGTGTRARVRARVPLIAAGGISDAAQVAAALAAGATAVQLGTAFLRCTESGTNPAYRAALADPRFTVNGTAITRAFSGRRARSLVNGFMRAHPDAPAAYPEINNATRPLRAAAATAGDPDHMSLYAGVGFARAQARSVGEIVERLVSGWPA